MKNSQPWPDPADKKALRAWLVAEREASVRGTPTTMAELREQQLRKIGRESARVAATGEAASRRRPILRFSLDGEAVLGTRVEAGVLGNWLQNLQTTVHSVAYALDDMRLTREAGPVPKKIQQATRLLSGPVFSSSYGMVLEGYAAGQAEIPGSGGDMLLDRAVNRILDVTDQANSPDGAGEAVLDTVLPLGRRAISHLSELSDVLASSGTNVTLTWQSDITERRVSRLTSASADRCRKSLRAAQIQDSVEVLSGVVVGGSKLRGSIELELADGNVVVLRAPKDDVTRLLADYAQREVTADVHVLTARSPGGREHRSHVLMAIAGGGAEGVN